MITQFSDSLVISFKVNEQSEVFHTLNEIQHLIMNFLYKGMLLRGAIVYGKLIHTDKIVFGPGLVKAYETESQAALYPRVILDKTIIEIAKVFPLTKGYSHYEEEAIMDIVSIDTDNMYFIDYIGKVQSELDYPTQEMPTYISKLNYIINKNLKTEIPSVKVKIGWLINKYNLLIENAKSKNHLQSLRKGGELELAEYYQKLSKIT